MNRAEQRTAAGAADDATLLRPATERIAALRRDVLRGALTFMAAGVPLLTVVVVLLTVVRRPLTAVDGLVLCFVCTFPALRVFGRRLPFGGAAFTLLLLVTVLAFLVEVRAGPNAGPVALNLIGIVLSGVLFGRRGALLAMLVSLILMAVAAWLVLAGRVPPVQHAMWDTSRGEAWGRGVAALGIFGAAAATAVVYVVRRFESEAAELHGALERERGERAAREAAEADQERARVGMEAAARMEVLGRMAGGVAHDFNNLLTVILNCAAELEGDLGSGRPADPELVRDITTAGERARDVTGQLLAFARRQVISPVSLDLGAQVRGTEKMLRRILGEDIELEVTSPPGLWTVRCDPGHLEQVILNLAVNARDAMAGRGRLSITLSNVEVDEGRRAAHPFLQPGAFVRLTIRDTGHGMSPEVKQHAFEPFFTTKPEGRGTGLGLAMVYGIVKQSSGFILIDSEPGKGTGFEILLPRVAEAPSTVAAPSAARTTGGTETILVVEDDVQVRQVTIRSLEAVGYRVIVAADGREALEAASRHPETALLVTDVIMPGLNGRELAERLRPGRPDLRVLYVSGYTQDVISRAGVLDSETEFLPKPFTATLLQERVRKALDRAG